jgi:hypothetical protein
MTFKAWPDHHDPNDTEQAFEFCFRPTSTGAVITGATVVVRAGDGTTDADPTLPEEMDLTISSIAWGASTARNGELVQGVTFIPTGGSVAANGDQRLYAIRCRASFSDGASRDGTMLLKVRQG